MADASAILMNSLFHQIDVEDTKEIEDALDLKDLSANLTKDPIPNVLESQVDHSTKIRFIALDAKNSATCRRIAQN